MVVHAIRDELARDTRRAQVHHRAPFLEVVKPTDPSQTPSRSQAASMTVMTLRSNRTATGATAKTGKMTLLSLYLITTIAGLVNLSFRP
jgi:hypothetical protein